MTKERPKKFSTLHEDPQTPFIKHEAGVGEWESILEGKKFDPTDRSTIERLAQYGVDFQELDIDPREITGEQYTELMIEALRAKYELLFASVFDPKTMDLPIDDIAQRLAYTQQMCAKYGQWGINVLDNAHQPNTLESGNTNIVISLEGADHVRGIDDAKLLIDSGVRCFGLQYNKDNFLANENEGLTKAGRETLRYVWEQGVPVDLAHSTLVVRNSVLDFAESEGTSNLVLYTHGSTLADVPPNWQGKVAENRVLDDNEVKRIIKGGGMIGLGVTQPFFGSIEGIADRINDTAQLDNGINSLGIGSDFGGVWKELMIGIESIDDLSKLADKLSERHSISDDDIDKVLLTNAQDWVERTIGA